MGGTCSPAGILYMGQVFFAPLHNTADIGDKYESDGDANRAVPRALLGVFAAAAPGTIPII